MTKTTRTQLVCAALCALCALCAMSCNWTGETVIEPPESSGGSRPLHLQPPRPEPDTSIDPAEALPLCQAAARREAERIARAREAALDGGAPVVARTAPTGPLISSEAVRTVVLRELGAIARCQHDAMLGDDPHAGRMVVRFVIGPTGAVLAAAVQSASIENRYQRQCIVNAVRHWQFPPPENQGIVTVSYPFQLQEAVSIDTTAP